jgi:sulfur transfer complex TusBCD TusB component (DsrH family)
MAKRILSIIDGAYRATLEEQDDTVVWFTHSMRAAGAEMSLVLRGNAVNYAVRGQDASGLVFGDRRQTNPPRIEEYVAKLPGKGVEVFAIEDDLAERGVDRSELIEGMKLVPATELVKLIAAHDQVWNW